MIVATDRQMAIELIDVACAAGARQASACAVLEIDTRTLRRWRRQREKHMLCDRRKAAAQTRAMGNKRTPQERERILAICNEPDYQSLPRHRSCRVWLTKAYTWPLSQVFTGCYEMPACSIAAVARKRRVR